MKQRLETEDIYALFVGLHFPFALKRYLGAKEHPVYHKVAEANVILARSWGTILYYEEIIDLCALAGLKIRDAKLFRSYQFLSAKEQERLMKTFIAGYMKLGYSREDVYELFHYMAYTASDCLKREYVAKHVKRYIETAYLQMM